MLNNAFHVAHLNLPSEAFNSTIHVKKTMLNNAFRVAHLNLPSEAFNSSIHRQKSHVEQCVSCCTSRSTSMKYQPYIQHEVSAIYPTDRIFMKFKTLAHKIAIDHQNFFWWRYMHRYAHTSHKVRSHVLLRVRSFYCKYAHLIASAHVYDYCTRYCARIFTKILSVVNYYPMT